MKFNVEIDLDFVEEGETLSDTIKNEIVSNIERRVTANIHQQIKESVSKRIEEQLEKMAIEAVSTAVNSKVSELMALPRTQTDNYGRVVKENFTIEQLLINAVESAVLEKTLDENGRQSNYGARFSRFEYFATKDIPALVDKKVKEMSESVKKDIEDQVSNKIKGAVADKLTQLIVDNSTALSLKS